MFISLVHSAAQNLWIVITALYLWHLVLHSVNVSFTHIMPTCKQRQSMCAHSTDSPFRRSSHGLVMVPTTEIGMCTIDQGYLKIKFTKNLTYPTLAVISATLIFMNHKNKPFCLLSRYMSVYLAWGWPEAADRRVVSCWVTICLWLPLPGQTLKLGSSFPGC